MECFEVKSGWNTECRDSQGAGVGFGMGSDESNPPVDCNPNPDFTWITNTAPDILFWDEDCLVFFAP